MSKKLCKILQSIALIITILMVATGCVDINYGKYTEDQIVEYMANVVINHDKNYIVKLSDREENRKEESTTSGSNTEQQETTNTDISNNGNNSNNSDNSSSNQVEAGNKLDADKEAFTLTEAINFNGIGFEYNGHEVTEMYPRGNAGFSMIANNGYKLLVIKINAKNNGDSAIMLDMSSLSNKYRCEINNSKRINAQLTMLTNALNTYNSILDAKASKELVLIFQINNELSANINNIKLIIDTDSDSKTVNLQ